MPKSNKKNILLILSTFGLIVIVCLSINKFTEIKNDTELDYVFEIVRHGARTPYDNADRFSGPA